jgi:hypothetical protein
MAKKMLGNLSPEEKVEVRRMLERQKKRLEEALDGVNDDIEALLTPAAPKRKSTRKRAAKRRPRKT